MMLSECENAMENGLEAAIYTMLLYGTLLSCMRDACKAAKVVIPL